MTRVLWPCGCAITLAIGCGNPFENDRELLGKLSGDIPGMPQKTVGVLAESPPRMGADEIQGLVVRYYDLVLLRGRLRQEVSGELGQKQGEHKREKRRRKSPISARHALLLLYAGNLS